MPKKIQLATSLNGVYTTLPGNTGELSNEAGELADTIFGQNYESTETGLISYTISSNALYKGFAGYVVNLMKGGAPVVMTDEPMNLVSGKTYQVTSVTKQFLDPDTTIVVEDNGVDHTADVDNINFLTGEVTFKSAYAPTGPITITGAYIPMTQINGARSFTLTQTATAVDNTDIPTAKANGGFRTFEATGLKTVSLELGGFFKAINGHQAALLARDPIYVSINPDGSDLSVARGVFKYTGRSQSGDVGALEEETINLRLNVLDNDLWTTGFTWRHAALSKLNTAIRYALAAWENGTTVFVQYLYDGTNGQKGEAVVTDISLSGGLEAMNEFTVNLQGSGAPTAVP